MAGLTLNYLSPHPQAPKAQLPFKQASGFTAEFLQLCWRALKLDICILNVLTFLQLVS